MTEYFKYLLSQDRQQLKEQMNSARGEWSACEAYASLDLLESLLPQLVEPSYEHGPFKLICDDFGLGNLIVKSCDDLTVIGVVDLEWSYAGPAQLFASAPWWLLCDRPVNERWDYSGAEPPELTGKYIRFLDLFISVLKEEEAKMDKKELSPLMEWSKTSGAMWLHMLLSTGFLDALSFPNGKLRRHYGLRWWLDSRSPLEDREETKEFGRKKERELDRYDTQVDQIEELKALMDRGELTAEDFVARVPSILSQTDASDEKIDSE